MLNFLNSIPIFNRGEFVFTIDDKNFIYIFDYFYNTLYSFSKLNQVVFSDFRVILLSSIYMRLNSNKVSIVGLIMNQTAGIGLPPGINKIVNLLPLNGFINLAGFVTLRFSLNPTLTTEVENFASNGTIYKALSSFRRGCNYDRIVFEDVGLFIKTFVTINSFFCTINLDAVRGDKNVLDGVLEFVLCVPSYVSEMTNSLAVTILFNVNVNAIDFYNITIALGSKYMNKINQEMAISSLVITSLVHVFGSDNVNFGRSNYSTVPSANRVDRTKLSTSDKTNVITPKKVREDKRIGKKDSALTPAGTPPATEEVAKIISDFISKIIKSSNLKAEQLIEDLNIIFRDKRLII